MVFRCVALVVMWILLLPGQVLAEDASSLSCLPVVSSAETTVGSSDMPTVTVSPASTPPGSSVDVLGSGFAANIKLTISIDGGFTDFVLRAKRDGSFGCGVLVGPQSTIGTHK